MKAGIFPATMNYEHPDPEMGLEGSGLLIAPEPMEWRRRDGQPRRFQVNAFGFGGSNYVVQVEQAMDDGERIPCSPGRETGLECEPGGCSPTLHGVRLFRAEMDGLNYRMAGVEQSEEAALTVIARSTDLTQAGIASPKVVRALAQQGIFMNRENSPSPPLAFVFSGQGAQYAGMSRDLYESFPEIKEGMDRAAAAADFNILQMLFHDREENLQKTRWQQPAPVRHGIRRGPITSPSWESAPWRWPDIAWAN